jgi:sugar phosphate permease
LVLACAWSLFFGSYVDRLAWANLSAPAGKALNIPVPALGIFASAFSVGYVAGNALAGFAADRLGPRLTLLISIAPLGLFTALFGATTTLTMGCALQALMGLTAGTAFVCGVKLIATWFGAVGRATAMGLFVTGTSVGVVTTNFLAPTVMHWIGWRGVYYVLGAATVGLALFSYLVLRDRPNAAAPLAASPRAFTFLARSRNFWILTVANIGGPWATWGFALWANILLVHRFGLTPAAAGRIVATFGIGAIAAKPAVGLLSDAMGGARKHLAIATLAMFCVALLVFGDLRSVREFALFSPILGVTAFAYSPLVSTMIAEVGGPELAGAASGFSQVINTAIGADQPIAIGLVYYATHSFFLAFAALAAGPATAALALLWVREEDQVIG